MEIFKDKKLEDCFKKSIMCMEKMQLPSGFLQVDPDMWAACDDFSISLEIIQAMKVVNDHAEWGIALVQEFSSLLTTEEVQLHVVDEHTIERFRTAGSGLWLDTSTQTLIKA